MYIWILDLYKLIFQIFKYLCVHSIDKINEIGITLLKATHAEEPAMRCNGFGFLMLTLIH